MRAPARTCRRAAPQKRAVQWCAWKSLLQDGLIWEAGGGRKGCDGGSGMMDVFVEAGGEECRGDEVILKSFSYYYKYQDFWK